MNREKTHSETLDLVIVGGGPAGMAAALIAGRGLLNTVVINAEAPRNAVTQASHGYLSRDGIHPLDLLTISKDQLAKYPNVSYLKDKVVGIDKQAGGFLVATAEGKAFMAKRMMFATGLKDNIASLGIQGLEAVYGESVYPCPFCDGWEHRDQALALFGRGEWIGEFAKTVRHWSRDLIIFTHGDTSLSPDSTARLEQKGVSVETTTIACLDHTEGKLDAVVLEDGRRIKRQAGFIFDTAEAQATDLPDKLGVSQSEDGSYDADAAGKTNIEGVYVVGDSRTGFNGLMAAAAEGASAAEMIVHDVINDGWN